MRYLGLDYGSKTLGMSISDEMGIIASNIGTKRYDEEEDLLKELSIVVEKNNVDKVVLGLPLNLNGTESDRSKLTREFGSKLECLLNKEVIYQDERFTTREAQRILISNNTKRKNRKKVIDSISAVIILQSYLDRK